MAGDLENEASVSLGALGGELLLYPLTSRLRSPLSSLISRRVVVHPTRECEGTPDGQGGAGSERRNPHSRKNGRGVLGYDQRGFTEALVRIDELI